MKTFFLSLLIFSCCQTISLAHRAEITGTGTYDYYVDLKSSEKAFNKIKEEEPQTYLKDGEQLRRSDRIKFRLVFNNLQAIFELEQQVVPIPEDALAYSTAVIIVSNAKDAYYIDHKKQLRLSLGKIENSPANIIKAYQKYEWTLTGEKMIVADRKLLQATTKPTIRTQDGNESTATAQVWYPPDIPVSFGPLGYDGLPGLIMQLRFGPEFVTGFTAIEIEIHWQAKSKEIRKPKAVAEMTEGDFQSKTRERMLSRQR